MLLWYSYWPGLCPTWTRWTGCCPTWRSWELSTSSTGSPDSTSTSWVSPSVRPSGAWCRGEGSGADTCTRQPRLGSPWSWRSVQGWSWATPPPARTSRGRRRSSSRTRTTSSGRSPREPAADLLKSARQSLMSNRFARQKNNQKRKTILFSDRN